MPIYKTKNENFFKRWSSEMAYILGFFAADGSMTVNQRGAHYTDFYITDRKLLSKIRKALGSNHKIRATKRRKNWNTTYHLQIGSKEIFKDLSKLGFTSRKSKYIKLPNVPRRYFSDFVRGYFDGDGCVSLGNYQQKNRKKSSRILMTRFTTGNKNFLQDLLEFLQKYTNIKGGTIYKKKGSFELTFSIKDSLRLYRFMYADIKSNFFLERKYQIFQKALNYWGRSSIG